jgi:hypothetical protein
MSKQILPHNIQGFGKSILADIMILAELDDNSLIRTCEINSYFRGLCQNDDLWKMKLATKYGDKIISLIPSDWNLQKFYFKLSNSKTRQQFLRDLRYMSLYGNPISQYLEKQGITPKYKYFGTIDKSWPKFPKFQIGELSNPNDPWAWYRITIRLMLTIAEHIGMLSILDPTPLTKPERDQLIEKLRKITKYEYQVGGFPYHLLKLADYLSDKDPELILENDFKRLGLMM